MSSSASKKPSNKDNVTCGPVVFVWCVGGLFVLIAVLVLVNKASTSPVKTPEARQGDLVPNNDGRHRKLIKATRGAQVIPKQYIVTFRSDVVDSGAHARYLAKASDEMGVVVRYKYDASFNGATMTNVSGPLLQRLLKDPTVLSVEEDIVLHTGSRDSFLEGDAIRVQEDPPSWGLDRIDQVSPVLDGKYYYRNTGRGVTVFIFDNGIRATHQEFAGGQRKVVACGFNAWEAEGDPCHDEFGHGTHVAGTVGGKTYGVAKEVDLVAVKVLRIPDGSTTTSALLAAFDYVQDYQSEPPQPKIVHMSAGVPTSASVNEGVNALVDAGVVFVTCAMNDGADACAWSPSSASKAITVGSIMHVDGEDVADAHSNFGHCVDIYAPGENITSAWKRNDTDFGVASGTSMAAPHVTGVAAMILEQHPDWSPEQVWKELKKYALSDVIQNLSETSPNLLLNMEATLCGSVRGKINAERDITDTPPS